MRARQSDRRVRIMLRDFSALLERFRATHRQMRLSHNGHEWRYLTSGSGEPVILLEGGMGNGESYFEYILGLEEEFRVVAPGVPASVHKLDAVLDGLAAILDAESIPAIHLFGHSQGGFVAHAFARKYHSRTKNLILSSTALPGESHARKVEWQLRLLPVFPEWLVRKALPRQLEKLMKANAPEFSADDRAFWTSYIVKGTRSLKASALSSAGIQLDYHRNWSFQGAWTGRTLIFHSEGDTLITSQEFADLRVVFPAAETHIFRGTGHLTLLAHCPEYVEAIKRFIAPGDSGSADVTG